MPIRYFTNEFKADVTVAFHNAKAINSALNQVLFFLTEYLSGIALDQLSYQISVSGLSFSTSLNNGLMIKANGFTQHLT
jgi:protease-3